MPTKHELSTVREAVGIFDDVDSLQSAIDDLLSSGFDRAELSLLAGTHTVEEKLGHLYAKVDELEDDANVPRAAYISTEAIGGAEGALVGTPLYIAAGVAAGIVAAAGGPLAAIIGAAVAAGGAGAAAGSVLAALLDKHHAQHLEQQLKHGGLLLWVRTWTGEDEERAKKILVKYSAHDVHIHTFAANGNKT